MDNMTEWCVLGIILLVSANSDSFPTSGDTSIQSSHDHLRQHNIPLLKMLKRDIRDFRSGRRALVTIVFRCSTRYQVRWFRKQSSLPRAEVINMLPVEGDPSYRISSLSSGDVIASYLTINNFHGDFPQLFETIITAANNTMQYQITTSIPKATHHHRENIDGPEWSLIPAPELAFLPGSVVTMGCKVFVPFQVDSASNELMLIKAMPDRNSTGGVNLRRIAVIRSDKISEQNDNRVLQGQRRSNHLGHATFEQNITVHNVTSYFEGIYVCRLERGSEKFYVKSLATPVSRQFSLHKAPTVWLTPCNDHDLSTNRNGHIFVLRNHTTCIRCRAAGYPVPRVALFRKNEGQVTEMGNFRNVSVSKYVNVADGGLAEALYTFRAPHESAKGRYSCRAHSDSGQDHYDFRIIYRG